MSAFGDLMRRLRKERGWTLEAVSKKIGSHKGYVSGIENDKVNPPSAKLVKKIARVFGVDESRLLRLSVASKAPSRVREEFLDFAKAFDSDLDLALFAKKYFGISVEQYREFNLACASPDARVVFLKKYFGIEETKRETVS